MKAGELKELRLRLNLMNESFDKVLKKAIAQHLEQNPVKREPTQHELELRRKLVLKFLRII